MNSQTFVTQASGPRREASLGLVVAMIVTLISSLFAAPDVLAQGSPPSLSVSSQVLDGSDRFTTIVSLDPGDVELGAVSAFLEYDVTALAFDECRVGALAACHPGAGQVSFAAIAPTGFAAEPSFVAIDFRVVDPGATSDLVVTTKAVVSIVGGPVGEVLLSHGSVTPGEQGGLNGEVRDQNGVGLFGMQACAVSTSAHTTCTVTTGLGAFIIDGLASDDYSLIISDPNGLLGTESQVVSVAGSAVTTGIEVTMTSRRGSEDPAMSTPVPVPSEELVDLEAASQQIAVQVTAANGGFPVFGTNVCAVMPLIGTEKCAFTDADGVARLSDLGTGNYRLSATDPAGRFGSSEPIFVGLNPGKGVVADLVLPDRQR